MLPEMIRTREGYTRDIPCQIACASVGIAGTIELQMGSPENNLAWRLINSALERGLGDRVAIREADRSVTYAQLSDRVGRMSTALRTLRVGKGERVAILMRDSLDMAVAILGTMHAGGVAVPISELSRPLDVRDYLLDASATIAVVHESLEPTLDGVRASLPKLREVLTTGVRAPGERDLYSAVRAAAPAPVAWAVEPQDVAMLLYSAGSNTNNTNNADTPRGVPHVHATPDAAFKSFGQGIIGLDESDRVFSIVRLSTAYGLGTGLLFPLAAGAETVLLPEQPRSEVLFETIATLQPTIMFATPSVYGQLTRDVELAGVEKPLSGIRMCVSGAEGMPLKLIPRIRENLGIDVQVGYGLTEAFQFVLFGSAHAKRPGACGRPVPGFEARVVDDAGLPAGSDEIGTLQIRGPTLLERYWHQDEPPLSKDGWFTTRDRFIMDDTGEFYHSGRVDDLFKVGGKWVSPVEIERTLLGCEAVWECAVIGADDDEGFAKPLAFVVPNVGHEAGDALEAELREYVKQELAPYKYPRWIEFIDQLPKGPTGKVLRYKLRASQRPRRAETAAEDPSES